MLGKRFAALKFIAFVNKQRKNCLRTCLRLGYRKLQVHRNFNCVIDGQWMQSLLNEVCCVWLTKTTMSEMDNEGNRFVIHGLLDKEERLWVFNPCLFFCCIAAVQFFKKCMVDDPGMSTAVAAIQTLLEFMNQNSG